jgi:hypothetical protein
MTPELLASIAAMLLSLAASYLPGFSTWYSALDTLFKRLLMLILLAAVSAAAYALACAGYASSLHISLSCDAPGALDLFKTFLAALLANQATYQLTAPKSGG